MATIRTNIRVNPGRAKTDRVAMAAFLRSEPGIQRDMARRGDRMMAGWRADVKPGKLASTFRMKPGTRKGPGVTCIAGVEGQTDYLGFYHDGTRAHEILPKRNRRNPHLRYVSRGHGVVFRKRVWHPGFVGNPFLTKNIPLAGD